MSLHAILFGYRSSYLGIMNHDLKWLRRCCRFNWCGCAWYLAQVTSKQQQTTWFEQADRTELSDPHCKKLFTTSCRTQEETSSFWRVYYGSLVVIHNSPTIIPEEYPTKNAVTVGFPTASGSEPWDLNSFFHTWLIPRMAKAQRKMG